MTRIKPYVPCPGCKGDGTETYEFPSHIVRLLGFLRGTQKCRTCDGFGIVSRADSVRFASTHFCSTKTDTKETPK